MAAVVFTTDAAINRGLGSQPGNSGGRNTSKRPGDGGTPPADLFFWKLEDGSDYWGLEDGTGNWLLEDAP